MSSHLSRERADSLNIQPVISTVDPGSIGVDSHLKPVFVTESDLSARQPESFPLTSDGPSRGNCTWNTICSSPRTPTDSLTAGIGLCVPQTGHLCAHRHTHAELYYIISGCGVVTIDGKETRVEKGTTVFIPGDAEHGIRNDGDEDLRWFYCFAADSFTDVVYRFS